MSIRISVKDFCERRGVTYQGNEVTSGYRLKLAVGMNSPTTANQLWQSDMRKIGLDTIEDLCRTLGCTPNDLFAFDPPLAQSTPAVLFTRDEPVVNKTRAKKSAKSATVKKPPGKAKRAA